MFSWLKSKNGPSTQSPKQTVIGDEVERANNLSNALMTLLRSDRHDLMNGLAGSIFYIQQQYLNEFGFDINFHGNVPPDSKLFLAVDALLAGLSAGSNSCWEKYHDSKVAEDKQLKTRVALFESAFEFWSTSLFALKDPRNAALRMTVETNHLILLYAEKTEVIKYADFLNKQGLFSFGRIKMNAAHWPFRSDEELADLGITISKVKREMFDILELQEGRSVADDKTKKDYRDKTRINMNEPYEVSYFKEKFGVSGQALAGAIKATGSTSVKKVAEYLKNR